jgi:polyferredoxin
MDDAREAARRLVRRKRTFLTILVVYLALSVLWLAIDLLTGGDDLWFYWPMLGAGVIVAVIGIAMFGLGGLFGADWERRQIDRYLQRRG